MESYQHGKRISGERQSRLEHITAWTWNAVEEFCMHLCSSACVGLCVCVCAQKIKHLDTSRHKKSLCPDASFVQGLSRCTIFRSPKKKYCGKKDYLDAQHNVQLSKGSTSLVYADNILLFKPLSSPSDMKELQDDVDRICE